MGSPCRPRIQRASALNCDSVTKSSNSVAATALSTSWPDRPETPELAAAATEFELFVTESQFKALTRWILSRHGEPIEWQEAWAFGDSLLYLTPAEVAELRDDLQKLGEQYLERLADPALRPEGARPVTLLLMAFPRIDE